MEVWVWWGEREEEGEEGRKQMETSVDEATEDFQVNDRKLGEIGGAMEEE